MKKSLTHIVLAGMGLICAMLSTSCSYYYCPQVGHMPLVRQQGELVAEAGVAVAEGIFNNAQTLIEEGQWANDYSYQAALSYAVTDHIAVQLSSRNWESQRHQVMAGWYTPLGEQATVEVYGGYAYEKCSQEGGSLSSNVTPWIRNGWTQTVFLQGDVGLPSYKPAWSNKLEFTAGVGLRVGGLWAQYHQVDYDRTYENGEWHSEIGSEDDYSTSGFELQPMIQFGMGGSRWKGEAALGYSYVICPLDNWEFPFCANVCVTYRIPLMHRSK